MTNARIFGTDGIRGRAGTGFLTSPGSAAVGLAVGQVLARRAPAGGKPRALLGHDGRRSGPTLEAALASGLAHAGFGVASCGLTTTPGLATLVRLGGYELGVMVSASHNPAEDNGIKVFGRGGDKLDDALELEVEAVLTAKPEVLLPAVRLAADPELERAYLAHLRRAAADLSLEGLTIAIDCANGGASRVAPRILAELGARVRAVACEPDGENINAGCGAVHTESIRAAVRREGAQLGIALDGDGDRCMLADQRAELVDGDGILTAMAYHAHKHGGLVPACVVATVMSNRGLYRALRPIGIELVTVDVGDRRVVEGMRRTGARLGGEPSGHVLFGEDNAFVGDGIYTALRVLRVMRESREPLSALVAPFRALPQVLVNVRVRGKPPLSELTEAAILAAQTERELAGNGRVLLRYSGTEPLARVMVEGPDAEWIGERAQAIAAAIARSIGSGG